MLLIVAGRRAHRYASGDCNSGRQCSIRWPKAESFAEAWGQQYPAIVRLWRNSWPEFVPFLDYDVELGRAIRPTKAIESLNARYRRAIKARGHFPTEQAPLKCLCLTTRSLDPTGRGQAR